PAIGFLGPIHHAGPLAANLVNDDFLAVVELIDLPVSRSRSGSDGEKPVSPGLQAMDQAAGAVRCLPVTTVFHDGNIKFPPRPGSLRLTIERQGECSSPSRAAARIAWIHNGHGDLDL